MKKIIAKPAAVIGSRRSIVLLNIILNIFSPPDGATPESTLWESSKGSSVNLFGSF